MFQNIINQIQYLFGNTKGKIIILFENDEFEFSLLKLVEKLKLDAIYTYMLDLGKKVIIQKEWYQNGILVKDNFDEGDNIKFNKYSLARSLR